MQYVVAFLLLFTTAAYAKVTSVGAIFATQSLLLQRIYIPDNDDSEIAKQFVGPGESLQSVPISVLKSGGVPAVQAAIGTPLISGRTAVVDKGTSQVIDVIIADPALYGDPRGLVIPSDAAMVGDAWDGSKFSRSYSQVDKTTGAITKIETQPIDAPVADLNSVVMVTPPAAFIGKVVLPPSKIQSDSK